MTKTTARKPLTGPQLAGLWLCSNPTTTDITLPPALVGRRPVGTNTYVALIERGLIGTLEVERGTWRGTRRHYLTEAGAALVAELIAAVYDEAHEMNAGYDAVHRIELTAQRADKLGLAADWRRFRTGRDPVEALGLAHAHATCGTKNRRVWVDGDGELDEFEYDVTEVYGQPATRRVFAYHNDVKVVDTYTATGMVIIECGVARYLGGGDLGDKSARCLVALIKADMEIAAAQAADYRIGAELEDRRLRHGEHCCQISYFVYSDIAALACERRAARRAAEQAERDRRAIEHEVELRAHNQQMTRCDQRHQGHGHARDSRFAIDTWSVYRDCDHDEAVKDDADRAFALPVTRALAALALDTMAPLFTPDGDEATVTRVSLSDEWNQATPCPDRALVEVAGALRWYPLAQLTPGRSLLAIAARDRRKQ